MFCARRVRGTAGLLAVGVAISLFVAAPSVIAARTQAAGRSCAYASTPLGQISPRQIRVTVICLMNNERRRWHLPALRENRKLNRAAVEFTRHLVRSGVLAHGDVAGRFNRLGYRWSALGENLATGYDTAEDAMTAWMGDRGHCANILSPQFLNVGADGTQRPMRDSHVGPGTWTVEFGRRIGQATKSRNNGPAASCPH